MSSLYNFCNALHAAVFLAISTDSPHPIPINFLSEYNPTRYTDNIVFFPEVLHNLASTLDILFFLISDASNS